MSGEDGRYVLLYCGIDSHDHDTMCLQPLEGCVVLLFEFSVDLIYCKDRLRQNPSGSKSWERRPADSSEKDRECRWKQVESLLHKLPDNCSLEDIQYHLYVLDKVRRGVDDARQQGAVSQEDAEKRLSPWLSE
jgi:hypothetical protein